MRRTLLSFYLILTLGLGLHAQILMPGNDGGEKTVAISSDETFYDSGGKDKGIPRNVVSAITFTPRPGEVIEITLEELELTGGAGLYCYNGVVKLIKEEDSEGEESYTRPRNPKPFLSYPHDMATKVIRSRSLDGKVTLVFENGNGTGKGWVAKVSSTPRRADDSKLPDGEVRISTTPQTITVGDKPLNFYDDGGKDGKITEQFEGRITFVPKTAGKHVKITFNKLDLFNTNPLRNDQLHIYNGKEAKADKLLRTLLKDKTPIVLRSGSDDGALTVTLKSTTGVTKDGFEAVVEEYTPQDMTLVDILQSQASSGKSVTAGSVKQEILQLNLQTKDNLKPLTATALTFTTEGSTEGIISRAELWTVGEGSVKPAVKLGEATSVGKTFTITLSSPYTLSEGDNNLILYYDIAEHATTGGTIDAALTSAVISGKTQTPSKTEVTGNRPIKNEVISAEGHHTYKVFGEWSFTSKTAPYSGNYEGGNKDQITTFVPDASGRVIEIDFKSFSVYYGKGSLNPKAKFEVYDGTTASGTPIWKVDVTNYNEGPKTLRSSSADGALTIVFNPNQLSSTYTDKGWTAQLRSVTPKAMTVTRATGFQASTAVVPVGGAKQAILGLELQTEGFLSPLTLDQLKVKLKGNEGHLSRIALYASHDKKEFNTSYLVAEASAPLTTEVTLVPTANKTLAVGANYYYLAFDLKADAPAGIDLDASFGELTLSGSSQAITTPDPDGARRTSLQHIFEGGKDVTVDVTSPLLFYDAGGPDHAAPKTTESGSVHFRPRAGEIIRCTVVRVANTKSQKLNLYSGASTDEKNLIHKLTSDDKAAEAFISYAADGSMTIQYVKGYGESDWELSIESITPRPLAVKTVKVEASEPKTLLRGEKEVPFVHIQVSVEGERQSVTVSGLNLTALDETSQKALSKRSIYTTGSESAFSSNELFGSTEDATATAITGSITYDKPGVYHYWLTGDIASTASVGAEVKMSLQSVAVKDGSAVSPSTSAEGKHSIKQGMSGTYTIRASSEAKYKTLKEATDELSRIGADGAVTFLIEKGTYTGMVLIPEIPGLSSTNTLTIRSKSGNREDVVFDIKEYKKAQWKSGDNPGHFTIDGTDYLTLEAVSIKAATGGESKQAPAALLIRNKSEHVTIRNCYVWAPEATDYATGTLAGVRTAAENVANRNSDYFTLEGSTIEGGYQGAYIDGASYTVLPKLRGALVKGNTFVGQGSVGIYSTKVNEAILEDNHIIGSGKVASPYKAIDAVLTGSTTIRGNKIEIHDLVAVGKYRELNALYLRGGSVAENTPGRNLIYNNELRLTADNHLSPVYGIYFSDAHIGKADILHNSVSITGPADKKNTAALANIGKNNTLEHDVTIKNNLLQNHTGGYVYYLNRATMKTGLTLSHNANFTSGANYAYLGEAVDINKWKSETGDATSIEEEAAFFDEASSLLPKKVGGLRFAPRLPEVTKDITSTERPNPATAGAYEVTDHTTPALEAGYPRVDKVEVTTARLVVKATEFGKLLYKVLPSSDAAPTVDELKASTTSLIFSKGTEQTKALTGLTAETEYKLYGLLLGLNDEYTAPFTPVTFTTGYPKTEVSTFENVAIGKTTFDDGTAHFEGFEVVQEAKGATAGSEHIAKVISPADVSITNSRNNLVLDGFWLRSDKELVLKAKDKDGKETKSKTLPSSDGKWTFVNLRELGALHSLTLVTLGTVHIDDFSGAPAALTLDATTETAKSGETKTLSVSASGGVAPYTYTWTDALGKEVSTEASYTTKADHTRLYKVVAKDAWGTTTSAGKLLRVASDAVLATFDDLALASESHWTGDPEQTEDVQTTTFYSGSYGFTNTYMKKWASWGGYAYSNHTATTYSQLADQYNGVVGHGVADSKNYGVAYLFGDTKLEVTHAAKAVIPGMYISNTAWVKHVSEHGTGLGDEPNTPFKKGDYYKITAISNDDESKKVDFYLADYRSENPADHYVIDTWQWLDLSALGEVSSIRFTAMGTRANQFGSTIPFYFILDNVGGKIIEEQAAQVTIRPATTQALELTKLFSTTTLPKKAGATVTYTLLEAPNASLATAVVKEGKLEVTTKAKGETSLLVKAVSRGAAVYLRIPLTVGEPPVTDDTANITDLRVLPSPAVDYITLTTTGRVEIFSIAGECLYRNANYRRGDRINVSAYTPGIYVVRAGGSSQRFIKK